MQSATITGLAAVGAALTIGLGPAGALRAQGGELPNCTGWSNCNRGRDVCTFERFPPHVGPTIVATGNDGISGDGRGPYIAARDGVQASFVVLGHVGLYFGDAGGSKNGRMLTVNLNHPVPGGGGVPLGMVAVIGDNALYTAWQRVGNLSRSLVNIPVGQTVPAAQMNVSFHLNGRFHILQMGPLPFGNCHLGTETTHIHGAGTSSGTIYRASQSKWVMDLPAGSVGRLFDVSHTTQHANDKGLYYVRLHYEIADAVPGVAGVLRRLVETGGAASVVARYRALKRDSAQAYFFDEEQLNPPGYWLLDNKRPLEAMTVFRLNLEEYPGGWNAHDGLGESYLAVADTANAVANYRRSLELNPKNTNAADVLKRLGANP